MLMTSIILPGHFYRFSTDLNHYLFRIRFEKAKNKCNTFLKYNVHSDYHMLDDFGWFRDLAIKSTVE